MTSAPPAVEQLFDMFLQGLTWLREDKPEVLARPGGSIFGALRHANVITEGQRRTLARNTRLISHAMTNSEIIKGKRRPRKSMIEERLALSDKLILTLVMPDGSLNFSKFFGPKGYLHVVTEAGMVHAGNVASKYEALIDRERFNAGWMGFRSQIVAMKTRQSTKTGPTPPSTPDDDEAQPHITQRALYTEEDFEWHD